MGKRGRDHSFPLLNNHDFCCLNGKSTMDAKEAQQSKTESLLGHMSRQTQPRLRIKKKDYTIPVRLNQHLPKNNNMSSSSSYQRSLISKFECPNYLQRLRELASIKISTLSFVLIIAILLNTSHVSCDKTSALEGSKSFAQTPSILGSTNTRKSTRKPEVQSHTAKLMSALESIERQHFKMNQQMKVFGSKRPSKFDSGEDFTPEYQPTLVSSSSNRFNQHSLLEEDPMQSILSMHQQASEASQQQLQSNQEETSKSSNRWKNVKESVKAASNLVNSNKMVSQMFSYISPLVSGSKLLASDDASQGTRLPILSTSALNFDKVASADSNGGNDSSSTGTMASKLRNLVSPYVARSTGSYLLGGLVGKSKLEPSTFVTSQPQTSYLMKPAVGHEVSTKPSSQLIQIDTAKDLMAADSSTSQISSALNSPPSSITKVTTSTRSSNKLKNNHMAHNYIQDSFRGLLTLTQLPILAGGQISTAPSVLERAKYKPRKEINNSTQPLSLISLISDEQRRRALDELYRFAYIIGTGVRRKKDPLAALGTTSLQSQISPLLGFNNRNNNQLKGSSFLSSSQQKDQMEFNSIDNYAKKLKTLLSLDRLDGSTKKARPRGVMWDMATDPSLVVTVFHLLERASVALPLGFLLMPFVQMIRNPFSGIGLGRILPPRASHRSVDYEELAKRLDLVDKMLSKALRSTHRDGSSLMGK